MTKTELLNVMAQWGACLSATKYVENHPSSDARVIWEECTEVGWLIWLGGRVAPQVIAAFAKSCAASAADYARAERETQLQDLRARFSEIFG